MRVGGVVRVPGDKSISHRALMVAALSTGTSRLRGLLDAADVRSTASVLRALGVTVPDVAGDEVVITGVGLRGMRTPSVELDCGNSGTTTRLIAGIVAGQPIAATFVGDASLSARPMRRVAEPLRAMGAPVTLGGGDRLPMRVQGGVLRDTRWESEVASAQVKSAVLFAALTAGVRAVLHEPSRSRDHTERMLGEAGVGVHRAAGGVEIDPVDALRATDRDVPGDPSSAAFFAALAAASDGGELLLRDICVNPTRTGFFAVLQRMGARVLTEDAHMRDGEPVATLVAGPGALRGAEVTGAEVPSLIDELPMLACLATRAQGETIVSGAAELRVKESDRIAIVVANLRAIGAECDEMPDGFRIIGGPRPLRGRIVTGGDHRIAMAFGVLGALSGNDIEIDDRDCVGVSYPTFWRDLARATGRPTPSE